MDLTRLPDETLIAETTRAAATERRATGELLTLLIEVERRGLHLSLGHSSMFVFCTRTLRLSEQAAYSRITAARTARRFPEILARLEDGALSLSSVGLLAPHLTDETVELMLDAATHKSTREVERLIAAWDPQPDVPSVLRALPSREPKIGQAPASLVFAEPASSSEDSARIGSLAEAVSQPPREDPLLNRRAVAPIAPRRYLLKLTIDQDTHDTLQSLRVLLRHSIPDGDTETILKRALGSLLDQVERKKWARSSRPRATASTVGKGRHIPAAVKREVWRRDGGRCVFTGGDGCCGETAFLEYHHIVPFAAGGPTDVANLQLRCRAHNAYEAIAQSGAQDHCLQW